MNYIGIRGHRGAGKQTIAYLLGNSIDWIINKRNKIEKFSLEDFDLDFKKWCDLIKSNEDIIHDTTLNKVYFDSFGDAPKTFVSLLLGIDLNVTNNDYYKDHMIINIKDFSSKLYEVIPDNIKCITAEDLYKMLCNKKEPAVILKDTYISLRDFIMYFGREVMQRYFGLNVWVKTLQTSDEWYLSTYNDTNYYKIYMDIKFPSEVTYIKDKNGIVIKVNRPGSKKKGSDRLLHDDRYDYEISIGESLYDLKDIIFEISNEIIENNILKNGKKN